MAAKGSTGNEQVQIDQHKIIITNDSSSTVDQTSNALAARPKLLSAVASNLSARLSHLHVNDDNKPVMHEVTMNWQGRYKALGKNSTALSPLHTLSEKSSENLMAKARAHHSAAEAIHESSSQHEQNAMRNLFGEEITQHHLTIFATLKKLIARWRTRAAQRKNIIAVEHFASDEVQKRALIKHKEQAMINLPMPITWAIKEEVLSVLIEVVKVYTKEFGNNHRLTTEARKRIDKLQLDLSKPKE